MSNKLNDTVITRIPPYSYIHIIDKNDNVTRLLTGPKSFVRQEHEQIVLDVTQMVKLNSQQYCLITNPVVKDDEGQVKIDKYGQAQLRYGDLEYRFFQDPFPLYPGEVMKLPPTKLKIVLSDKALVLRAEYDFVDVNGEKRISGDKWLFKGPATYIPNKAVEVVEEISAIEIKPNTAIKLRALKEGTDSTGTMRYFGEEWLVKKAGAYMLSPYENLIGVVDAINLDEYTSLRVKALRTHTDEFGKQRKHGSEWLITHKDTESHIPSVFEEVIERVNAITLNNRQYCVILNPVDEHFVPQNGKKKLVKGDCSFFLQPGEVLENGQVKDNYVLSENEALILKANENVGDHKAGEKWMIRGPLDYVPPVEVEVIDQRSAIPLDANEGIYVRNIKTGKIRSVTGETYILTQDEELWEKDLPVEVRKLLSKKQDPLADRGYQSVNAKVTNMKRMPNNEDDGVDYLDSTRVVTYRVPHNAAVQIYDFKAKKARIAFGPDLVMLDPEEQFTMLSISGGKPKRPNVIKSICLLLGPDFCTDVITVETADHARLSLQLSYNWHFDVSDNMSQEDASKLFSVPDFIGDSCKAIASRIRGNVASVQFDDFHKNSAKIIRSSVFGYDENKKIRDSFRFPQNNLVITSIDVQSVEPVDQRTRDALQKSVQLAIEITTNSQEANARHEAERLEQEARGRLERQKLEDEAAAEKSRMELLELQVQSTIVESTGQAKAEAKARAEAARIEGEMAVESAELKNKAMDIEAQGELGRLKEAREAELIYLKEKDEIEILRKAKMAELDTNKFTSMIKTLGADNLKAIASAGPDQDVRMLKALGLQSTLITDGATPINLLQTAHGLIGSAMGANAKAHFESSDNISEGNKRIRRESIDLA